HTAAAPPDAVPDPPQDHSAALPSNVDFLLHAARTLLTYGRHLIDTIRQRATTPNFNTIAAGFGTANIATILAHLNRGILPPPTPLPPDPPPPPRPPHPPLPPPPSPPRPPPPPPPTPQTHPRTHTPPPPSPTPTTRRPPPPPPAATPPPPPAPPAGTIPSSSCQ